MASCLPDSVARSNHPYVGSWITVAHWCRRQACRICGSDLKSHAMMPGAPPEHSNYSTRTFKLLNRHGRAEYVTAAAVAFLRPPTRQPSSPPLSLTSTVTQSPNSDHPGGTVLSPFDDFPIHPSADPIAHPATGDTNHYDRYWFNGHHRDGAFYFGAAMGHYPVRGVIDGAFSLVRDGVEHSMFASAGDAARPIDHHRPDPHRGRRADAHHPLRRRAQRARHRVRPDLPRHDRRRRGTPPARRRPRES